MPSTTPPPAPDPLQETLERALDLVTPEVDTHAVTEEIERRRTASHRTRGRRTRVRVATAAVVATAACLVGVLALRGGPVDRVDTVRSADAAGSGTTGTDPTTGTATSSTIVPGQLGAAVEVPGRGPRVIGLGAPDEDGFWIARGDPLDATDPVETTITRVTTDGSVGASAEIGGVPLMATELGGQLWVVAEDRVVSPSDPTRYRLKRIDAGSGEVLQSSPLAVAMPVGIGSERGELVLRDSGALVHLDVGSVGGATTSTLVPEADASAGQLPPEQVLEVDGVRWVLTAGRSLSVRRDGDAAEVGTSLVVPAPLVAASGWSPGAVATLLPTVDGGQQLVEIAAPPASSAPVVRVDGLPAGASLVDVRADRVWVVRGGQLLSLAVP